MRDLVRQGKDGLTSDSRGVRATIRRAMSLHPDPRATNGISLWSRVLEDEIARDRLGAVGFDSSRTAPLGRGFLTGQIKRPQDIQEGDWRKEHPRFRARTSRKPRTPSGFAGTARKKALHARPARPWRWLRRSGRRHRPDPRHLIARTSRKTSAPSRDVCRRRARGGWTRWAARRARYAEGGMRTDHG